MEIKNGMRVEMDVRDFGVNGEGVGVYGGFTVFVDHAVPGDRVAAELYGVKKSYGFGRLIELVKRSDIRETPSCPSFGECGGGCGGCAFLHIGYTAELEYKKKKVNDALRRIGGLGFEINEIIGMSEPYFYRNKAVYHISDDGRAGFYGAKTRSIAPVDGCVMFGSENAEILKAFERYLSETKNADVNGLMVRRSSHTGDLLVCVLSKRRNIPNRAGLVYHMTQAAPQIKGITLATAKNGVLEESAAFVWGEKYILDKIGKYTFKVSSGTFFQVNGRMTETLYRKVAEYACGSEILIDAYSGTGAIAVWLSGLAKELIGIERSGAAVIDAEENAELNNVSNTRFISGDAGETLVRLHGDGLRPDTVVLDPPRSGCAQNVIDGLSLLLPERIIYVSCDPATLARDLKRIAGLGYKPDTGVCVDMFARCAHVEAVVKLCRYKS